MAQTLGPRRLGQHGRAAVARRSQLPWGQRAWVMGVAPLLLSLYFLHFLPGHCPPVPPLPLGEKEVGEEFKL